MTKRALLLAACLVATAGLAHAKHNMAGCGLGSMLFKENEKPHQILAATTNGLFGNQTFGISSETLGCTKDGMVRADKARQVYAEVNLQKLSREMAAGNGEYLTAFASLMGCKDSASQKAFGQLTQQKYEKILPTEKTDAETLIDNLQTEMSKDPVVSKSCTL